MAMSDLVEFLRARYDDEERDALAWPEHRRTWQTVGKRSVRYDNGCSDSFEAIDVTGNTVDYWEQIHVLRGDGLSAHISRHDPARVLREVEAKRRMVRDISTLTEFDWGEPDGSTRSDYVEAFRGMLRLLALPYADHAEYRAEWKP